MTILLNTIFILFIGIWFIRFFVEMDVPENTEFLDFSKYNRL